MHRPAGLMLVLLVLLAQGCGRQDAEAVWDEARVAFEARRFDRARMLMDRIGRLREATPEDHLLRAQLLIARDQVDDALAELNAVPEGHKIDGFHLRLTSPGAGDNGGAGEEKNSVVVYRDGDRLHFRIYDREGKLVADKDEAGLPARPARIAGLKKQLADLWPPHRLTEEEEGRIIAEMAPLFDHANLAAQARLEAGQLELRRDRARIAEEFLLEAARLKPDLAKAHSELIFIYGYELRRAELAEQFRALNACEPLTFQQVFLWCLTRGVVWEPAEAADKLAKFVAADPDDRQARLALAEMLRRLNRYDDADKAIAPLKDDDPEARATRAQLALDRGDDRAAEALLSGGPRDHLNLALLRGRLAIARGDDKAAVAAFRHALAVEPNNRDAVFGFAHALQRAGAPEAERYLDLSARHERLGTLVQRAAVPGSARDVKLIRELGAACADIGRIPEARAWYSLAIKMDQFDSEAQQAVYRLKDKDKPPAP